MLPSWAATPTASGTAPNTVAITVTHPHGHADIRGGETRRIIHAVTYHCDFAPTSTLPELHDRLDLLCGRKIGVHLAETEFPRHRFGGLPPVLRGGVHPDSADGRLRSQKLHQFTRPVRIMVI